MQIHTRKDLWDVKTFCPNISGSCARKEQKLEVGNVENLKSARR